MGLTIFVALLAAILGLMVGFLIGVAVGQNGWGSRRYAMGSSDPEVWTDSETWTGPGVWTDSGTWTGPGASTGGIWTGGAASADPGTSAGGAASAAGGIGAGAAGQDDVDHSEPFTGSDVSAGTETRPDPTPRPSTPGAVDVPQAKQNLPAERSSARSPEIRRDSWRRSPRDPMLLPPLRSADEEDAPKTPMDDGMPGPAAAAAGTPVMGGGPEPSVVAHRERQPQSLPAVLRSGPGPDLRMSAAGYSLYTGFANHVGWRRKRNEDVCYADDTLLVVADGVGGSPGGHTAAQTAVRELVDAWKNRGGSADTALLGGFREANYAVRERGRSDARLLGLATTLDACGLHDGRLVGAHVGDGYAWVIDPEKPEVMWATRPHSVNRELVRYIGAAEPPHVDRWETEAKPETRLVLASDGLTADLGEEYVTELLLVFRDLTPPKAAAKLVERALDAGGSDNITVVVADVVALQPAARPVAQPLASNLPTTL